MILNWHGEKRSSFSLTHWLRRCGCLNIGKDIKFCTKIKVLKETCGTRYWSPTGLTKITSTSDETLLLKEIANFAIPSFFKAKIPWGVWTLENGKERKKSKSNFLSIVWFEESQKKNREKKCEENLSCYEEIFFLPNMRGKWRKNLFSVVCRVRYID